MPQYTKSEFSSELALSVLNEIHYQRYNYYSFLGKCDPWSDTDSIVGVTQAQSALDYKKIRNNMVYMKRVTANDVSMVIRKIDWTISQAPRVYDQYDDGINLINKDYYCVTEDWDVFKCLFNNHGTLSTTNPVKPSTEFTGIINHNAPGEDGYIWKYMYNIPSFKRTKFVVDSTVYFDDRNVQHKGPGYIPVQKALSDSFYNKGSVENIIITNSGYGYSYDPITTIVVTSPPVGGVDGFATMIPSIRTTDLLGSNGEVLEAAGQIVKVTITKGGNEDGVTGHGLYTPTPEGGNYPTLTVTVNPAYVPPDVDHMYSGKYKTETPGVLNPNAILIPVIENGYIVNVLIKDPGKNYPVNVDTSIVVSGDGKNAVFTPVVNLAGEIIDVITENSGTGYNVMILNVDDHDHGGQGAQLMPMLGVSDYSSTQSDVELAAEENAGSVYTVVIEDKGSNYDPATTEVIINEIAGGDGGQPDPVTGSTALSKFTAVVSEIGSETVDGVTYNNRIQKITVTCPGLGYSYLNLTVTDQYHNTSAKVRAVFPPLGGHGYDAINELNCHAVVINSFIQKDVLLNKFGQDYRQLGIIKNPKSRVTQHTFRDAVVNLCFEVVFRDVIGLKSQINVGPGKETILVMSSNSVSTFRVIAVNDKHVLLQQVDNTYISPLGNLFNKDDISEVYTSVQVISAPTVDKFSGKLLYVSDELPFSFTDNQGLNIKTFLEF